MADFWRDLVWAAIRNLGITLRVVIPSVLAMLTLLALGTLLGWIAGALIGRVARAVDLDRRSGTWGLTTALLRAGVERAPSDVARLLVFWSVFAVFATMGIDALSIPGAPGATGVLMQVLPRLLAAALIVVVGWLVANFLGQTALIAAVNAGLPEARFLARAARWAVLLLACAVALTEVGIARDMVLIAFAITFGGIVLSLALAFGLGGRILARQILERRLRRDRESVPDKTMSEP
ncbi:MAG: hypothetical protein HY727_02700 [Candidatus Rokubacteria bacterium]|nr:hypothetical protein [Candidatus Rokubacteria bacterium]